MEDIKVLILIANRVQDALTDIKHGRYAELLSQLTHFADGLVEDYGAVQKAPDISGTRLAISSSGLLRCRQ